MSPVGLVEILENIKYKPPKNVLVSFFPFDDAGVYQINEEVTLVQTVDFITPIVDDPYNFGRVATANSLSDIYAMGGVPITALNILAFPSKTLPTEVIGDILKGSIEILNKANVALLGGHSVEDTELKFGLAVTGLINPKKMLLKNGAKLGDLLVLTKPLGSGILSTALKKRMLPRKYLIPLIESMVELNDVASKLALKYNANACTDITGYGLVGHAYEIANESNVGIVIGLENINLLPGTLEMAKKGVINRGNTINRQYVGSFRIKGDPNRFLVISAFDPQTSGGLLISIKPNDAFKLIEELRQKGIKNAHIIGKVIEDNEPPIILVEKLEI